MAQEPPEAQRRAVELVASGEAKTAVEGVRKARSDQAGRRRSQDTDVVPMTYQGDGISIYRAFVSDLQDFVGPNSVDVVVCAPPGDLRTASLSNLASFSSHALTDEGLLIVAADTRGASRNTGSSGSRRPRGGYARSS